MIKQLLVIRFSAMGDVAMTVPVIASLAHAYPHLTISFLTQQRLVPLFSWMPSNVKVIGVNLNDYHGISGLNHLYQSLQPHKFDAVADIHDVLRTKYIRTRFKIRGKKVAVINKGRKDRKALIGNGITHPALIPIIDKYIQVFENLGLHFSKSYTPPVLSAEDRLPFEIDYPAVGVAPFAAHQGKIYPLGQMQQVVNILAETGNHVYLFGAGSHELSILKSWERNNITLATDKLGGLKNELILMSKLKLMISMDSSNMHMAAMMGTQTISIWGATHPKAGFMAWNQNNQSVLQVEMPCRPCSIYGSRPCTHGNYPCMQQISPLSIIELARKYGAK